MVSFERFVIDDSNPIYLQITLFVKRGIAAGIIKCHDEMPSRRVLSATLGVNPNTVQRAYRMLEEEGVIESRLGAKSYNSVDEKQVEDIRTQLLESDVCAIVRTMQQLGASEEETVELVRKLWKQVESGSDLK